MSTIENNTILFYEPRNDVEITVLSKDEMAVSNVVAERARVESSRPLHVGRAIIRVNETPKMLKDLQQDILSSNETQNQMPVMVFRHEDYNYLVQAPVAAWRTLEVTDKDTQVEVWLYLIAIGKDWEVTQTPIEKID